MYLNDVVVLVCFDFFVSMMCCMYIIVVITHCILLIIYVCPGDIWVGYDALSGYKYHSLHQTYGFWYIFDIWPISTWYFEVGSRGGVLRPTLFFVFYFYIFNLGQTYKVDWKYGYTDGHKGSPCWTGRVYDVVLIIVNTVYSRYLLSLWCKIIDIFLLL